MLYQQENKGGVIMEWSNWKKGRWMALLALGLTLLIELFNHKAFAEGPGAFWTFAVQQPLALLVCWLIVLITLLPALFLRRQVFWCALASAVWLAAGTANGFILLNRMTPFTIADLTVVNTGLSTLPNYLSTAAMLALALAVVLVVLGLALLFWKGPKSQCPRRQRWRAGLLALVVTAGALGGSGVLAFRTRQLSSVFANLAYAYEDYGFAYCFFQTWLNKGIRRPLSYGPGAVERVLSRIETNTPADTAARTDVNVVYVQLESFIDPAEIRGLTLSRDAAPNWRALTADYSSGYLTVPVVGAGTANTECEVLTGMSTRFFGPGEYPYETRLLDRTAESVAYDLKENGYAAHAIHNHMATFYNREQVYANLGFDDFTSLEYMPLTEITPQNWAKDSVLTSQILQALDATPNQPDLVFTVSVQGHGKYPTEPVLENPAVTVGSCPDPERRDAVEYYVNQIYEVDAFVGALTDALSQRGEKTLLVLYGDHLPSLGLTAGDMASGSLFRTRYVIWDNFGLEKQDEDLTAYQLSGAALGRIGVASGVLNAFQQFCREEPSYRADLRLLQYDVLYGENYLYGKRGPYPAADMEMGMVPITIRGVSRAGEYWYISGEHFSPYCRVTAGEHLLKTEYLSPTYLRVREDPGDLADLSITVVDSHHNILSGTE